MATKKSASKKPASKKGAAKPRGAKKTSKGTQRSAKKGGGAKRAGASAAKFGMIQGFGGIADELLRQLRRKPDCRVRCFQAFLRRLTQNSSPAAVAAAGRQLQRCINNCR